MIGGLLYLFAFALEYRLPAGVFGGVVLAAWLALTGLLHFDGLLDAADALLPPVDRERRIVILRDTSVGSFALGVGVVHLLLKAELLSALGASVALLAAPVAARAFLLLAVRLPAARSVGLAAGFRGKGAWWGWPPLILVAILFPPATLLAALGASAVYALAMVRLGGVNGDVHGAAIEVAELSFLFGAVLFGV